MEHIRPITISEFRKNTKVILDMANTRDIYIARGWQVFKLTKEGEVFNLPPEVKEKVESHPPRTIKPLNKVKKDYALCKHGAVKGFCKSGCK